MAAKPRVAALAALGIMLGACGMASTPLYGPDTPRNGADQPVDSVYGTPLPGYPSGRGG
jgi:hypothetical protein